jgi:hypothetical protein
MPVYQYENAKGQVREEVRTVAERDVCPEGYRRITVPQRLEVVGFRTDPTSADGSVPKAFKQLEESMPASRIARETGFSVDQIRKTWAI